MRRATLHFLLTTMLPVSRGSSRLRVLCLHGYAQNGAVLRDRSGGFRKPLKKSRFELHYPDGPFGCTANGEDIATADADATRRAWWRSMPSQDTYVGWEETKASLIELWSTEHFDGILGFSQGAGAAAMLAAELEPRFAILISGFVPRDASAGAKLFAGVPASCPSLHVFGLEDTLVLPERSRALVGCFANAAVISHTGGHHIPSGLPVRQQVVEFLETYGLTNPTSSVA